MSSAEARRPSSNVGLDIYELYLRDATARPLLTAQQELELGATKDAGYEARGFLAEYDQVRADYGPDIEPEKLRAHKRTVRAGEYAAKVLYESNLQLVIPFARRNAKGSVSILDLIQEGNIALLGAVEGYDYALDNRFSTYAVPLILQAIQKAVARQRTVPIPKSVFAAHQKINTAAIRLLACGNTNPTKEELLAETCMGDKPANFTLAYDNSVVIGGMASLDKPFSTEPGSMTLEDSIPAKSVDVAGQAELNLTWSRTQTLLNTFAAQSPLHARYVAVFKFFYMSGPAPSVIEALEELGKIAPKPSDNPYNEADIEAALANVLGFIRVEFGSRLDAGPAVIGNSRKIEPVHAEYHPQLNHKRTALFMRMARIASAHTAVDVPYLSRVVGLSTKAVQPLYDRAVLLGRADRAVHGHRLPRFTRSVEHWTARTTDDALVEQWSEIVDECDRLFLGKEDSASYGAFVMSVLEFRPRPEVFQRLRLEHPRFDKKGALHRQQYGPKFLTSTVERLLTELEVTRSAR